MKKIYSLILVAASLAVAACQPKELDNIVPDDNPDVKSVKITATIEDIDATKVIYNISDKAIKPTWEVDDELFGFDANGGKFTYVVKFVDENTGEATIEPKQGTYTPKEGTVVYGIYYPGKTVEDITGTTGEESLAIDLAGQSGTLETASPAIMCATATVTAGADGNEIRFKFLNQTAIIGLKKIQVCTDETPVASATIDQIAIEGVVTHGSLSVVGGQLTLKAGTKTSTVYAVPATSSWVTDENGQIDFVTEFNAPIAFAVLPKASSEPIVYAYTSTAAFKNKKAVGSKEMAAGHYYYMSKKLDASAEPVASLTVGGVTSKYYNVSDAFDAADCSNANCMVTLLKGCSATRQIALSNAKCSGAVTLDLNGKTLTAITDDIGLYIMNRSLTIQDSGENGAIVSNSSNKYALYLNTGANVTLKGGSINSAYRAVGIINSGNFTMNGGTISSTGYGIALGGSGNISVTGGSISGTRAINSITLTGDVTFTGTLSISGGTLEGTSGYAIYNTAGTVNITGGNASSTSSNVISSSGIVNIDGGTFTSSSTSSATIYISGAGAVGTISGGQFNSNALSTIAAANNGTAYVTGGLHSRAVQVKYAVDDNDNEYVNLLNTDNDTKATYPFAVGLVSGNPIVDYVVQGSNEWNHASLEGAFINAGHRAVVSSATNTTITQVDDATISGTINVNSGNLHSIILDLNGNVVSATGVTPMINAASDFTIMDSDSDGAGELSTTGDVALSVTGGTTTINSGSLVGATNAVSVAADATLTVNNGYFYGDENGDIADAEGAGITLNNGWYRNKPSADYLASGTAAISGSETHNTKTYNWTIGVETATVTVNEVGYASLGAAAAAANAFDGEAGTVTIKLLADISDASPMDLTNVNSKPIVLDLNGHTLSTETESFITTGGTLTITDSNIEGGGEIHSNSKNVLYLNNSSADVSVEKCLIKSTFSAASTAGGQAPNNSIIYLASSAKLSVTGNARIWATAAHVCYAAACTLNIENAELTSSNYCIYVGGAANIDISGENTSFYAANGGLLMYCNSASASIEVSGGYFYRNSTGSTPISSNNIDKYTFTGGHFSAVPTNATAASGYRFDEDADTHTHATTNTQLSYGYGVLYGLPNVADVNGTTYTSYADAITAALAYSDAQDTVRLTLLRNVSYNDTTNFVNASSKPIVLNLNGYELTTTVKEFIKCRANKLWVRGGTITSSEINVVNKVGSGTINIENCTIYSTATYAYATGYYYNEGVIRLNNSGSTINIKDSKIYTTNRLAAVVNRSGSLNIDNSEISSGTSSTGSIAVSTYQGTTTINSGCFYSSTDSTTRPPVYLAHSSGKLYVKGGYYYSENSSKTVRSTNATNTALIEVTGGYFNVANNSGTMIPKIPVGYAETPTSVTYGHSIKGTLSFSYVVGPTAQEASVEASTSTPVVTLGEAKTGGVSF